MRGRTVINWGATKYPTRVNHISSRVLNPFQAVNISGNKLLTFQQLRENPNVRIPDFTTQQAEAARWVADGIPVICRTILRGHSGQGIVLATTEAELVSAPLYTKYVKKKHEYRVHVGMGEVFDIQQKRRRTEFDGEVNNQVRNHQNGWVYCRENITEPRELRSMAMAAIQALGLDFGAVDIIYNEHRDECTVLEINTAPGLEGSTLTNYVNFFNRILNHE